MNQDRAAELRGHLVQELADGGFLRSPAWGEAFRRVPRHEFLRRFFRPTDAGTWEVIDEGHPDWLGLVYTNVTWVTQLDDDVSRWEAASSGPVTGRASSSSSEPGLMAQMLQGLQVRDGDAVLEIGTGTGYNAALLSHRLGSALVTTVEVDPELAAQAAKALERCGYTPTVAAGDGTEGHRARAPYDRIIATCSVPFTPGSWVVQTRPGGMILTSLHRDLGGWPMVRLVVDEHGASGRFLPDRGAFMPIRSRSVLNDRRLLAAALRGGDGGAPRPTTLGADILDHPDFGLLAALKLENACWIGKGMASNYELWLLDGEGSWACLDSAASAFRQHGPRRLWDELESAHDLWQRWGQPRRDRFGLSVSHDGSHIFWLDRPDNPLWVEEP
ncbi:MAG TPA: ATP-grasp peptide maturase system methyltransferase [Actinomycetota bacterium]|nr:ATP-grasp peptide maturase system methyltransferase [Actinomycetota bacterium]